MRIGERETGFCFFYFDNYFGGGPPPDQRGGPPPAFNTVTIALPITITEITMTFLFL